LKLREQLLKDIFVQNTFVVETIMGYVQAAAEFVLLIHIFACGWLWVGNLEGQWLNRLSEE